MNDLILKAIEAARTAGRAIMEVYAQPFEVYTKDDASPAKRAALTVISIQLFIPQK